MHQPAAKLPPHTETRRIESLHAYGILDTPVEAVFEEPGRCDDHPEDPYGESSPENVLSYLRDSAKAA